VRRAGRPSSIIFYFFQNSTAGAWGPVLLTIWRHPPKLRNLRHFQDLVPSGKAGAQKDEKGVGSARKMIYLGRHKI